MSIKSKAIFSATIAVIGIMFGGIAHGASLAEIKARGYMVVATEDDYPPFEFIKEGKPTGFDNEMVAALRKAAPFEIRQEILPFTGILAGVATGKYDVAMTAATITKERTQSLDFVAPIAEATEYYLKRADDKSISSVLDLDGKTIGVQAGSAQLAHLSQLKATLEKSGRKMGKVIEYTSYPEAYQDLALKRSDVVVNTIVNLRALVQEKGKMFVIGQPVATSSAVAWAVKKDNKELLNFLNEFVAAQKKNGNFGAMQNKWFGQTFDVPVNFVPQY